MHVASLLGGTVTLAAADAPYIGKWKANLDKSNFRETRVTYTRLPPGEMQVAGGLVARH